MSEKGEGNFPKTRWTLIARAKDPDATISRRALDELCTQYYYPLYCYIRRRGFGHHDAEDALQEFLGKLLRLRAFEAMDDRRGRLRSFLGTAVRRFLVNWHRDHRHREDELSLDLVPPGEDPERRFRGERFIDSDTPERIFDRKWGHELLASVLSRLGKSYAARGRVAVFDVLRPVIVAGGSLQSGDSARLAGTLGMSEGALRAALFRLLGEYRDILRDEVLHTVDSAAEVEEEISHLLAVFRSD